MKTRHPIGDTSVLKILFEVARIDEEHLGVKLGDTEWNRREPGGPHLRPGYNVDNLVLIIETSSISRKIRIACHEKDFMAVVGEGARGEPRWKRTNCE